LAHKHKVKPSAYVVLGDDVVIFDAILARAYQVVMSRLGVTINMQKSTVWTPQDNFIPYGEVAKRLILRYGEITPIPYKLTKVVFQYPDVGGLVLRLGLSGLGLSLDPSSWEALSNLLNLKGSKKEKFLVSATHPPGLFSSELRSTDPIPLPG
jgi:hypothetical protein